MDINTLESYKREAYNIIKSYFGAKELNDKLDWPIEVNGKIVNHTVPITVKDALNGYSTPQEYHDDVNAIHCVTGITSQHMTILMAVKQKATNPDVYDFVFSRGK